MTQVKHAPPIVLPADPLLSHDDAAHYLGIAPNTLAAYRQSGMPEIPYVQYGGRKSRVFYKKSILDDFIAKSMRTSTSAAAIAKLPTR